MERFSALVMFTNKSTFKILAGSLSPSARLVAVAKKKGFGLELGIENGLYETFIRLPELSCV